MKKLVCLVPLLLLGIGAVPLRAKTIREVRYQDMAALGRARTIAIKPIPITGKFHGVLKRTEYRKLFRDTLAEYLEALPGVEDVVLLAPGEKPGTDLVFEGEFTKMTSGSVLIRLLIGYGIGRSKCAVSLRAVSVESGKPVFHLVTARRSAWGWKRDELPENIEEICGDIRDALALARLEHPAAAPRKEDTLKKDTQAAGPSPAIQPPPDEPGRASAAASAPHPGAAPDPPEHP